MRREIEEFVNECLNKMKEKGLSQSDLVRQGGSVSLSTLGHLLKQHRQPTVVTVERLGRVLGVDGPIIQGAVKFARKGAAGVQWKKVPPKLEEPEKPSIPSVADRLREAYNHFQRGSKLLENINQDVQAILLDINEQIRLLEQTNGLHRKLMAFRK